MKRNRTMVAPLLMVVGGLIMILAVVGYVLSGQSPAPTPPLASSDLEATVQAIPRVSLADAKAAYDAKTAVFLDARDPGSYQGSHIPGAINIPEEELTSRLSELNKNDWIITYCT
jgi:3-mercaptopyruvate sulfurtransferase SseA